MLFGGTRMRVSCQYCSEVRERAATRGPRPTPWTRHGIYFAKWIVPAIALALLPKCPLCLATYVMIATGIGISFTTAVYLKGVFSVLCLASLVYLAGKRVGRIHSGLGP